jgi:hypothetical protein
VPASGAIVESDYNNETAHQYGEGYVADKALPPPERRAGAVLIVLTNRGSPLATVELALDSALF